MGGQSGDLQCWPPSTASLTSVFQQMLSQVTCKSHPCHFAAGREISLVSNQRWHGITSCISLSLPWRGFAMESLFGGLF